MQSVGTAPMRDPAPSRVKYKLQRMWLTPLYRTLIRKVLPVFFIAVMLLAYIRNPDVQQKFITHIDTARTTLEERPEFIIKQIRVQGATEGVDKALREALSVKFPISSFQIDLEELKKSVEKIEAIETASILVGAQGVLEVGIVERVPTVIWRNEDGLTMLDVNGQISGRLESRLDRPDLPIITGDGVEQYIPEALEIFRKLSSVSGRVRGLKRMGERRWDVVLERNQVLQLPENEPIAALQRVLALHNAQDILSRDIIAIDIRDNKKPILRLSPSALDGLKKLRSYADEKDS